MVRKHIKHKKGSMLLVVCITTGIILIGIGAFLSTNVIQSNLIKKEPRSVELSYCIDMLMKTAANQVQNASDTVLFAKDVFSRANSPLTSDPSILSYGVGGNHLASLNITTSEIYGGPVYWTHSNSQNTTSILCFGKVTGNYKVDASSPAIDVASYGMISYQIDEKPFTDFLFFSEYDTTNFFRTSNSWDGSVHSNGNLRMAPGATQIYNAPVSTAGYLMNVPCSGGGSIFADMNTYISSISANAYSPIYSKIKPSFSTNADVKFLKTDNSSTLSYKNGSSFYTDLDNGSGGRWSGSYPNDTFGNFTASKWGNNLMTKTSGITRLACPGTLNSDYNKFITTPSSTLNELLEKYFGTHTLIEPLRADSDINASSAITTSIIAAGSTLTSTQIYNRLKLIESQKLEGKCGLLCQLGTVIAPYDLNTRGSIARELNERYIYPQGTYTSTSYIASDLDIYNPAYAVTGPNDRTDSLWDCNNIAYARYEARIPVVEAPDDPTPGTGDGHHNHGHHYGWYKHGHHNHGHHYGWYFFKKFKRGCQGYSHDLTKSSFGWPVHAKKHNADIKLSFKFASDKPCTLSLRSGPNRTDTCYAKYRITHSGNYNKVLMNRLSDYFGRLFLCIEPDEPDVTVTFTDVSVDVAGNDYLLDFKTPVSGSTYYAESISNGQKTFVTKDLSTVTSTTQTAIYVTKNLQVPQFVEYSNGKWVVTLDSSARENARIVIWDARRRKWVYLIEVDASKLSTLPAVRASGIYIQLPDETDLQTLPTDIPADTFCQYVTDPNDGATTDIRTNFRANQLNEATRKAKYPQSDPIAFGVRLINAANLTEDLSLVTNGALYIQGSVNTGTRRKVLLAADSITVLSDKWLDYESRCSTRPYTNNGTPLNIIINASLITGCTHPGFMLGSGNSGTWVGDGDKGMEDAVRVLENRYPLNITVNGSIMCAYYSKASWEPWTQSCENASTSRKFSYYTSYKNSSGLRSDVPTIIPYYRTFKKIQMRIIKEDQYNALKALWNDSSNWNNSTTYNNNLTSILGSYK